MKVIAYITRLLPNWFTLVFDTLFDCDQFTALGFIFIIFVASLSFRLILGYFIELYDHKNYSLIFTCAFETPLFTLSFIFQILSFQRLRYCRALDTYFWVPSAPSAIGYIFWWSNEVVFEWGSLPIKPRFEDLSIYS